MADGARGRAVHADFAGAESDPLRRQAVKRSRESPFVDARPHRMGGRGVEVAVGALVRPSVARTAACSSTTGAVGRGASAGGAAGGSTVAAGGPGMVLTPEDGAGTAGRGASSQTTVRGGTSVGRVADAKLDSGAAGFASGVGETSAASQRASPSLTWRQVPLAGARVGATMCSRRQPAPGACRAALDPELRARRLASVPGSSRFRAGPLAEEMARARTLPTIAPGRSRRGGGCRRRSWGCAERRLAPPAVSRRVPVPAPHSSATDSMPASRPLPIRAARASRPPPPRASSDCAQPAPAS